MKSGGEPSRFRGSCASPALPPSHCHRLSFRFRVSSEPWPLGRLARPHVHTSPLCVELRRDVPKQEHHRPWKKHLPEAVHGRHNRVQGRQERLQEVQRTNRETHASQHNPEVCFEIPSWYRSKSTQYPTQLHAKPPLNLRHFQGVPRAIQINNIFPHPRSLVCSQQCRRCRPRTVVRPIPGW